MLREVRAAIGPERRLRVDANMAWTPETAGATLEQLEQLGVEYVEEPVAGLAAMAALRRSTSIPISAHSTDIPAAAESGSSGRARAQHRRMRRYRSHLAVCGRMRACGRRLSVLQRRPGYRHRRSATRRCGARVGDGPPPDAASLVPRRRDHGRPAASTPRPAAGAGRHTRLGRRSRPRCAAPWGRPIRVRRRIRLLRRTAIAAVLTTATRRRWESAETRATASSVTRLPATVRRRSPSPERRPAPLSADRYHDVRRLPKRSGWAR